jgi:hypothetical protein
VPTAAIRTRDKLAARRRHFAPPVSTSRLPQPPPSRNRPRPRGELAPRRRARGPLLPGLHRSALWSRRRAARRASHPIVDRPPWRTRMHRIRPSLIGCRRLPGRARCRSNRRRRPALGRWQRTPRVSPGGPANLRNAKTRLGYKPLMPFAAATARSSLPRPSRKPRVLQNA